MHARPLDILLALVLALGVCAGAWGWNEPGGEKDIALKLKPDYFRGMEIFRVCAKCHNPKGWGRRDGAFPQIAGQHYNVLIKQLADIRDRTRAAPGMYHMVLPEAIGDAQALTDLSAYIAKLPMNPANGVGPGTHLKRGEALYMDKCQGCHGDNGEGNNEKFYPRIQGQHYRYMLRQFQWIKLGERGNAHPDMVIRIENFSDEDTLAVIDFVSRLKPPKELLAPSRSWKNPDFE